MEDLPLELVQFVVPNARGWRMLSHTSKRMAAKLAATIVRFRGKYHVVMRSYNITFTNSLIKFKQGTTSYYDYTNMDKMESIVLITNTQSPAIFTMFSSDVMHAFMISGGALPYTVTATIKQVFIQKTEVGKDILQALNGKKVGNIYNGGVLLGMINNKVLQFTDGEKLGEGEYLMVICDTVVRATVNTAKILRRIPQLGGKLYGLEPLFCGKMKPTSPLTNAAICRQL